MLTLNEVEFKRVPLSAIVDWLEPREFSSEDVENMAASLRIHGQIQPIVVEPLGENVYRGIVGRLRYEASKAARLPDIECKIMRFKCDSERVAVQLAENLHRKEPGIQRCDWLKRYKEALKKELPKASEKAIIQTMIESVEKLTGEKVSERRIYEYLQVAEQLLDEVKKSIADVRNVGPDHCLELLRLSNDRDKQVELAERAANEGWSVRRLKSEVDKALGLGKPKLVCEFIEYAHALAKAIRESLPEGVSCAQCPIKPLCDEYKKAIFELAHEIKK
jgi:ParB family chromosome partitioning protein